MPEAAELPEAPIPTEISKTGRSLVGGARGDNKGGSFVDRPVTAPPSLKGDAAPTETEGRLGIVALEGGSAENMGVEAGVGGTGTGEPTETGEMGAASGEEAANSGLCKIEGVAVAVAAVDSGAAGETGDGAGVSDVSDAASAVVASPLEALDRRSLDAMAPILSRKAENIGFLPDRGVSD